MAPRNPKESLERTEQDEVLHPVHEALKDETSAPGKPLQHDAPVLAARPEETSKADVELDRVELYLKGPTVFTA